jgi:hypothetical protein
MKTWIIALIAISACPSFSFASDLSGYTFLMISGADSRAVVKTPEGEKQLVAPGDVLGEATITEITADRVVLEQPSENGTAMLIVRVKDGRQQVSRIQQMPVMENAVASEPGLSSRQFGQ